MVSLKFIICDTSLNKECKELDRWRFSIGGGGGDSFLLFSFKFLKQVNLRFSWGYRVNFKYVAIFTTFLWISECSQYYVTKMKSRNKLGDKTNEQKLSSMVFAFNIFSNDNYFALLIVWVVLYLYWLITAQQC